MIQVYPQITQISQISQIKKCQGRLKYKTRRQAGLLNLRKSAKSADEVF